MQQLQVKMDPRITGVVEQLQNAGYEAYVVGGAVRDFLLDRKPKDYDLSTSATPEEIRKVFRGQRTMIIGRRFRLVHLYLGQDIIEISTFRKCPSHEAQVQRPKRATDAPEQMIFNDNEYGTAKDDAHRRDFTINALFYDPVHDKIVDYTGMGQDDIKSGTIRVIGDPVLRFEEDPVRMLRALKLVGQYGFKMEEKTEQALNQVMPLIVHASVSRLTLELEKILKNPYGDAIIDTFHKYHFLSYFLPFFEKHYEESALKRVMAFWAKRNERLRAGKYRDSISLVLGLAAIPFHENTPGQLWNYREGIESEFYDDIRSMFAPLILTRRSTSCAVSHMMAQAKLKAMDKTMNVHSPSYATAREMALIQNETEWHIPGLEENLPEPVLYPRSKKRRKRKRRPDDNGQKNNCGGTPRNHRADRSEITDPEAVPCRKNSFLNRVLKFFHP